MTERHEGGTVDLIAREATRISRFLPRQDLPEVSELQVRLVFAGPAGVVVTSGTCRIRPALAQAHVTRRLH